jgi:deoxyribonuclease IV
VVARRTTPTDLPLGAHQSIAGGTPRAVERGLEAGCRVVQIFVKNNNRWQGKTIEDREAREFRRAVRRAGFRHVAAHTSYLINLAAPNAGLRRQSIAALCDEIARCHRLGIGDLVLHPGAHGGDGEAAGISRLAASLEDVFDRTADTRVRVLLETAAGQGTAVGRRFEELRDILGSLRDPRRVGVCLDTCHVHAAGYDLSSPRGYEETIGSLDRTVGLARVAAIHVNDSKKPRGSRVDRHEHIGRGAIGKPGFRNLMRDPRLAPIPKFLETPKDEAFAFDRANLATLRRLAGTGLTRPNR